ncbi:histidine phosphatase family protein [Paenibacillus radicis (ex Xue et al. 2023)]|uniref:Histidine phosphatase family protein n=1 Tax=Paenibacillus radicis (ex Xue et al. 2023) TaxID=2972489 RepID=A0ABT1YFF6_9BACL|nr:histidine phosphatase family protein [Paenibacillus radicis (ex Xue et al. 2023)]MCR8631911.1 histidine phosphatase family protein [Paenibacillus radicis (ex Xue et al. 2023)]
MQTIYLIRHCKATGQAAEAELTEEGWLQAQKLASFLHNYSIEYAISSPYVRAQQTLIPYAELAGLTIHTDARLSERILSGEQLENWMSCLELTFEDALLSYPGGESSCAAADRAIASLTELLALGHSAYAVATHGNLLSLILKRYDDSIGFADWKGLTNPDVYRLSFSEGSLQAMSRIWNG